MTLLFVFPDQAALGASLLKTGGYEAANWEGRHFPDGESYVRILADVKSKEVAILCSLNRPDEKIMPLVFLARTLRELGCRKITLVAPYLGYMRQDKRFKDGEAITSAVFGKLLSGYIDALITIDPHLHRYKALDEIYTCECSVLTAAPLMADWIAAHIEKPLIVGPDMESEQWVKDVAGRAQAPYVILSKTRHGDRDVEIVLPDLERFKGYTPVLIDDIISTAATMIKAIDLLRRQKYGQIVCLATHGVFADGAYDNLVKVGNVKVVTTNIIPHPSSAIDIAPLIPLAG